MSVVVVIVVVKFSHIHLHLQNHWPISTKLGTKYHWVKGIQFFFSFFFLNEGPSLFQGEIITNTRKYNDEFLKYFCPELLHRFQLNLTQNNLKGDSASFKWMTPPFSRGDNYEHVIKTMTNFKCLPFQNHWAKFNRNGTNHPWLKGYLVYSNEGSAFIQVCLNEGPDLFQGEIITKYQKYIDKWKKYSFPKPLGQL